MVDITSFNEDINLVGNRIKNQMGFDEEQSEKLDKAKEDLFFLKKNNGVKIYHSLMELILAGYFISKGYNEVYLEHQKGNLSFDLLARKGEGTVAVEIETDFIPPYESINSLTYLMSRVSSKISRYSNHIDDSGIPIGKFCIGIAPHYNIHIPSIFLKSPRYRESKEINEIKKFCDLYYKNPPVSLDEIINSRLHGIYSVNIDDAIVKEEDPRNYIVNI
jgi:hypothetical protein